MGQKVFTRILLLVALALALNIATSWVCVGVLNAFMAGGGIFCPGSHGHEFIYVAYITEWLIASLVFAFLTRKKLSVRYSFLLLALLPLALIAEAFIALLFVTT